MRAKDLVKAQLWCLDDTELSIDFQYNPTEISMSRTSSMKKAGGFEEAFGGGMDLDEGESDSLNFKILVDTSVVGEVDLADAADFATQMLAALNSLLAGSEENEESVLEAVQAFYTLTLPITDAAGLVHPPVVAFIWNEFVFMGFVTKCDVEFLLFDATGKAKRAEIDLELEGQSFAGDTTREEIMAANFVPDTVSGDGDTLPDGTDTGEGIGG